MFELTENPIRSANHPTIGAPMLAIAPAAKIRGIEVIKNKKDGKEKKERNWNLDFIP